jgi:hypothetical protein
MTYNKKNLVTFGTSLIELMQWSLTEEETLNHLPKAVQDINGFLSVWVRNNLWEKMTLDSFFTAVLLKGLHPGTFRTDLISKARKFQEDTKDVDDTAIQVSQVPTLRYILYLIEQEVESRDAFKGDGNSNINQHRQVQPQRPANQQNRAFKKPSDGNRWTQPPKMMIERAASAEGSVQDNTAYAPKRQFKTVVLPSANVNVYDATAKKREGTNGRVFKYFAVENLSQICSKCYPTSGLPTPCKPQCYQTRCATCGYYGHKALTCQQLLTADGKKIDA